MSRTPSIITSQMIWEKLLEIEKKVDSVIKREVHTSAATITMAQLCRQSGKGRAYWLTEIKEYGLPAIKHVSETGRAYYDIKIADLNKHLDARATEPEFVMPEVKIENTEDISRRIVQKFQRLRRVV